MADRSILERSRGPIALAVGVVAMWRMFRVGDNRIDDPDVWWVAAAGREMLATHSVPRTNLFSFVEPTHPWVMHEWLLGPPYAAALQHFGPSVFSFIALVVLAIDLALILAATVLRARHASVGLAMTFCAVCFFGGRFESARPAGVSLVFPLALALVAFAPRFRARALGMAVLLELVWANAHGSFPLGVVLLLVAAVAAPAQENDRAWRLAAAGAAAVVTLVTPYGLALYGLVWGYLQGSDGIFGAIKEAVGEFGSIAHANWVDGSTGPGGSIVVLVVFSALSAAALLRPAHRARASLCVALWVLAALHVRYFQLAGLLTCVALVPAADDLAEWLAARWSPPSPERARGSASSRGRTGKKGQARARAVAESEPARPSAPATEESPRWGRRTAGILVAASSALGITVFAINHGERTASGWIDTSATSLRGLASPEAIALVPDGANLWVPFRSGGIALWYGFPRGIRVFFDPRNDCYSPETFEASVQLELGRMTPDQVMKTFRSSGTSAVLLEKRRPLAGFLYLSKQKDWTLSGQDGEWWLFRHAP